MLKIELFSGYLKWQNLNKIYFVNKNKKNDFAK